MTAKLKDVVLVLARHARRELLCGPLGLPFAYRHRTLAQRLTLGNASSRRLWARLSSIGWLSLGTKKVVFRALYNAPLGPGDAAAPGRVVRRHAELYETLARTLQSA